MVILGFLYRVWLHLDSYEQEFFEEELRSIAHEYASKFKAGNMRTWTVTYTFQTEDNIDETEVHDRSMTSDLITFFDADFQVSLQEGGF